jgi:hypothetical protein
MRGERIKFLTCLGLPGTSRVRQARQVRLRLTAGLLVALLACGGSSPDDDDSAEDDPLEVETPRFLEPANAMFGLSVTHVEEVKLRVASITAGETRVEIDGRTMGTLAKRGVIGHLDVERLSLHMGGGMVAGRHNLQLVTPDPAAEDPRRSELVVVDLLPQTIATPSASAAQPTGLMGDALVAAGADDEGVLLLLDGDRAHLMPAHGTGWSLDTVRTIELPGLQRGPTGTCPPSAIRIVDHDDDRVRIAWRVGLPGTRIDLLEAPLHGDAPPEVTTILDLDPEIVGVVEYAALDCPVLHPRVVIAELLALTDTEQARPGDRALVSVTLLGDGLDPGRPRRFGFGETIDFDLVGPVVDLTSPPGVGSPTIGARMGGAWPVLIELDASSGTPLLLPGSTHAILALESVDRPLATVRGAFGSRTIGAVDRALNRLVIAQIDDSRRSAPTVRLLDELDTLPAHGPIAGSLVGGTPVFVVPMGGERPALAVTTRSAFPALRSLEQLRCDQVALPQARAANEGTTLAVACLRDAELHLATIDLD